MTSMSKKELISAVKSRYLKSDKRGKSQILDEFCMNTGYARKYAIAILAAGYDHNKVARVGRKRRKNKYGQDIMATVVKIWELLDFPCGQRLKPALPEIYSVLIRCQEIAFDETIKNKLETI